MEVLLKNLGWMRELRIDVDVVYVTKVFLECYLPKLTILVISSLRNTNIVIQTYLSILYFPTGKLGQVLMTQVELTLLSMIA